MLQDPVNIRLIIQKESEKSEESIILLLAIKESRSCFPKDTKLNDQIICLLCKWKPV